MSVTLDTNVLLYASDTASSLHARAGELLSEQARGPGLLYLFWPVLMGYLRIATHPTIFEQPLPARVAMANVAALLARPHVRAPGEDDGFWTAYTDVASSAGTRGNLVPDAHVVALMRQYDVGTIWSHDRDFRTFDGIRVRDPFS